MQNCRYSKPEEFSIVNIPLPELRENDVMVSLHVFPGKESIGTGKPLTNFCRSKSRHVVSAALISISMRVNFWPR